MTRKDFNMLASLIAASMEAQKAYPQAREAIAGFASNLASMLKISNPRFNRERFLKACNVPEEENPDAENS